MIDLSHLTEEEQEVIMTVLSRDAELKRAEEERIRKLENVLSSDTQQPDSNLKYFTGEWFYEAKSRRHMDTIHGSEIILASIKLKNSALDGSMRLETSKSPISQASDQTPPPKPARTWDALQPQEMTPAEIEALQIRSPRTPRHNPFNRASLLVVDAPENTPDISNGAEQQCAASSAGFRPVPKKRTFLSRRISTTQGPETQGPETQGPKTQGPETQGPKTQGPDTQGPETQGPETLGRPARVIPVVPAPRRRSLQHGSSESANRSNVKLQDNISINADATSPKPVEESAQACSTSSLEGNAPAPQRNSASPYITRDKETEDGQDDPTQRQPVVTVTVAPHSSSSIHHSDGENMSSVGSASRLESSFTRSSVAAEPPVSYDLTFIDTSGQQVQTKAKQELRLSTPATSPTGDKDDSITKVLDWFSRSSDSSDWLNDDDDDNDEIIPKTSKDVQSPPSREADPDTGKSHVSLETNKEMKQDTALPQEEDSDENEHANISNLKSFWEKSYAGPKILTSKSITTSDKESKASNNEEHGDTLSTTGTHSDIDVHKDATDHKEDSDNRPRIDPDAKESIHIIRTDSPDQKETHSGLKSFPGPELQLEKLSLTSLFAPTVQTNEEVNMRIPESQLQAKDNLGSDKPNGQISPKVQTRSSNEDMNKRNCGDRSPKSVPIREKSPVLNRHVSPQDIPQKDKERIKHLKSFWEQERANTGYIVKSRADKKVTSAKLNKRYAKSEFDLQLIGKGSDSEEDDNRPLQLSSRVQPVQKPEKSPPILGRRQFNSLREFWDEALSESKSIASDKPKSPKCKELPSTEIKCGDPEINNEKPSCRPALTRASPPPYRPRLPLDKQTGSRLESKPNHLNNHTTPDIVCQREVRKSSKDSGKLPKIRKDSFSTSSSRINSFRRAKSMFSLSTDEADQIQMDISPVHSQSRKQRANTDKGTGPRRHSEDTGTLTPRARAFVPTDYRHYLGMSDESSARASTVPALQDKGLKEVKSDRDNSRRGSRTQQRPLSPNYSRSDTCQESRSASESRSSSRLSSNRENDNDSPVRLALKRAETRPKNHLAKSLEDITAASSPRTERRKELSVDDGSSLPSPTSSLYMDPEHMKNMSKSVPSFSQRELSGSVMTVYSGDFGSVIVQGTIHFSIHYVQKLREFHIFVAQCKDLAPVDPKRGRSDPYVKSYLVPDKANLGKRKTSVKKKTLNPLFNEILRYRVRMEYLRTQTLILSVWHHDTFGKNSFLGEIDVDLSKWDFDHTQMNYLALKARTHPSLTPPNCRGEMRLAIRYVPQNSHSDGVTKAGPNTGEIHIWVKECKNLSLVRATIDPYVKCLILPDTSKKSRQKTRVLPGSVDPAFNHTMVYDGIRQADLMEACVELTVLDRDKLATNLLGGLRLGAGTGRSYGSLVDWMDSTAYEATLWDRMIASPNEWVEDVLPLRWLHSTKTTSK
ncbi:uncharacterized protein [Eucyclogobius newberryi]|uniref:uncharacterized protein isoform X2 n=1 Tax=Eucyclogobius newberryi TaxID=166745 RepID=UPI003B5B3233